MDGTVVVRLVNTPARLLGNRFRRLASRQRTSVLLVTLTAWLIGWVFFLVRGYPNPFVHDEFSYLLAADTFASGRLTNPPHPLWHCFESMHIIQQPTYASIYPVAQGLLLAASQRLTGHPWWGVWFSVGLMCGAICWMLQQWVPPGWALTGGLLSLYVLASYWLISYWGGAVAACAGALLLGAAARMSRRPEARWAWLMALAVAVLANSRPYEGLVLTASVGIWMLIRSRRAIRTAVLPFVIVIGATAGFMAYYNWRVTGSPTTLPYQVNFRTYLYRRMFLWQKNRPKPVYRHLEMQKAYEALERKDRSRLSVARAKFVKPVLLYFSLPIAAFGLAALLGWRSPRARPLLVFAAVMFVALGLEEWVHAHYSAPFAGALYGVVVLTIRRVNAWGKWGRAAVRTFVAAGLLMFVVKFTRLAAWKADASDFGANRARIERQLETTPGGHLVIVRYSANHDFHNEWVYNRADIDHAPVVWARDVSSPEREELIRYFSNRRLWLVDADHVPVPILQPYAPGGGDERR